MIGLEQLSYTFAESSDTNMDVCALVDIFGDGSEVDLTVSLTATSGPFAVEGTYASS